MKPHRTDGVSLSFGIIFLLVALWWAVSRVITVHLPAVGWMVAGGLIVFGGIGLLGAIRSGRRNPAPAPEQPVHIQAEPEVPGGLPAEMHASIVRELLDDPAERFTRENPAANPTASPATSPVANSAAGPAVNPVADADQDRRRD